MTGAPAEPTARGRGARPNILVILTDEERERCWWPASVRLPARERLARRGVRFTEHHVHSMPCSPSRSTIVTGQHAHRTGVLDNVDFPWQSSMDDDVATFGTLLRDAGYETAWHGKWHLSRRSELEADDGAPSLERHGFSGWTGPDVHGSPFAGHRRDGRFAEQAARWLRARSYRTRPWCCVVSFVNPHDIMLYPRFRKLRVDDWGVDLPANAADSLADKPRVQRRWRAVCDGLAGRVRSDERWRMIANAYIDLHVEVDRHIGTVLDALAASGAEDETFVIFTSDHGDMAGAHGLRQKGAFVYRETVNVPLTIAGPGIAAPGTTCGELTAAIDLVPTLCGLAGAPVPSDLPGRDLTPLVLAPPPSGAQRPRARPGSAVLFVHDAHSSIGPQGPTRGFGRGLYDGRWKYARWFVPGAQEAAPDACDLELYDTYEDPHEMRNLAYTAAGAAQVADFESRVRALVQQQIGADSVWPDRGRRGPLGLTRYVMRSDARAGVPPPSVPHLGRLPEPARRRPRGRVTSSSPVADDGAPVTSFSSRRGAGPTS